MDIDLESFPRYEKFEPSCPVHCVTPGKGGALHRFFDTAPFSPSGRYLTAFRLPYEDRLPSPGDAGEIVVVDLASGEESVVARSRGWEPQLGANLQWGADDETLIFNDVDVSDWSAHGVRLNWRSGEAKRLDGCVYHVSHDGRLGVSSDPLTMRRTQSGYGVVVPDGKVPRRVGPRADDGVWITDLETGRRRMLISSAEVFERVMPPAEREAAKSQEVYCFHSKWNRDASRIMFSMRRVPASAGGVFDAMRLGVHIRFDVFTIKPDGSDLRDAIPADLWERGGHHTTWRADGERLSFNLGDGAGGMDLMQVRYDGSGLRKICGKTKGSGHPSENLFKPGLFVTDSYPGEKVAYGDGTSPIRLIVEASDSETRPLRMPVETPFQKERNSLRVDPHVAWDRRGGMVAFNGFEGGTRRVYIADLRELL